MILSIGIAGYFFLIFLTLWFIWENLDSKEHLPPGPLKVPILGTLIQLGLSSRTPYLAIHKLALKYGDVMSVKFGFLDTVILSSYESIKDIFNRDDCNDRNCEGILKERCLNQNLGIILASGESWQTMRKFTARALREYGFGKRSSMEKIVSDELRHFMSHMRSLIQKNNGLLHFDIFFHATVVNIMWSLVAGRRYEYDDAKVIHLLDVTKKFIKAGKGGLGLLSALIPSLKFFFPAITGFNIQREANRDLHEYFREVLRESRSNLDNKLEPECFIDVFLKEMDQERKNANKVKYFTDDQFVLVLLDLFQAGSETTSSTLSFAILFLTVRPDIQEKIKQEILREIGFEREPMLQDRDNMMYTQAFMLETFRWGRIVVNFVPRRLHKDIYYNKFLIKKNTVIMGNQHGVNFDAKFWGDPNEFRPERFLNQKGLIDKSKSERVLAFGIGKRICLGETLARDSFFLYLTTLLQHFTFQSVPNKPPPCLEPSIGFTMSPVPFNAYVSYNCN